ncbi:lipopolysaccharide biosynthesis protein [Sphingobium boeckii]|uniref:O-antigen/teichoic acid export membrane protein n=1 Tax=Sphingobium boeckii TaxID=1082345 RepID=A0A7W9AIM8_9SPHN|nr:oligosaccharide flippase family protein [Sphingobium boeckii]MBB5686186.1 O-antigen/teichoic acid export membrane protein [Sphingobium boeckii]
MSDDTALPDPASDKVTNRDFARGLGTTLLARMGAVIEVVSQPLYVWLFGLASFGLYAVLWAAISLIENIADLGMTSALQRVVPQAKDERDAVAALRASLLLGVIPCLLIALGISLFAADVAPLINVAAKDRAVLIQSVQFFIWALPLWAFVEISTSALRARRLFGAEIRLRLLWEQVIRLVLAILFWLISPSILALLAAHLISLAITCLLSIRLLARHYDLTLLFERPLASPIFFETLRAGLSILPSNAIGRVFGDAPPIVLNALLPGAAGATSAALYTIARKVSSIVQLIRLAFGYVLAPLASAASRGGNEEVRRLYAFTTRFIFALAVPLGCVMAAGGDAILDLFGPGADQAHAALIILILARMAEAVFSASVAVQQVIGAYHRQITASLIGLAAAAAIVIPLIPRMGLTVMALAVGAGFIITAAIPLIQLHIHEKLHPFETPFGTVVIRTIGITIPALMLSLAASYLTPTWLQLPIILILGMAALWLTCRFALSQDDRAALGKTGRKLRLI